MINDEITSIEYIGIEETLDINVSGNRLFWADGLLTHNSAVDEQEHDISHIAGGLSKVNTADNVLTIFSSPAMRERGEYRLQFIKTRSSSGVGSKVYLKYDPSSLRMFDKPEEELTVDDTPSSLGIKSLENISGKSVSTAAQNATSKANSILAGLGVNRD